MNRERSGHGMIDKHSMICGHMLLLSRTDRVLRWQVPAHDSQQRLLASRGQLRLITPASGHGLCQGFASMCQRIGA